MPMATRCCRIGQAQPQEQPNADNCRRFDDAVGAGARRLGTERQLSLSSGMACLPLACHQRGVGDFVCRRALFFSDVDRAAED